MSTIFVGIVCATPKISSNFIKYNKNSITVNNFPNINESLKYDLVVLEMGIFVTLEQYLRRGNL